MWWLFYCQLKPSLLDSQPKFISRPIDALQSQIRSVLVKQHAFAQHTCRVYYFFTKNSSIMSTLDIDKRSDLLTTRGRLQTTFLSCLSIFTSSPTIAPWLIWLLVYWRYTVSHCLVLICFLNQALIRATPDNLVLSANDARNHADIIIQYVKKRNS